MLKRRDLRRDLALGAGYFALAAASIGSTRFDGGLAFLSLHASLLIAALAVLPRVRWVGPLVTCGIAGMLATGLVGAGWAAAMPLAIANLAEASAAALVLHRLRSPARRFGTMGWAATLVLAGGIVGPVAMASVATGAMWLLAGQDPLQTAQRVLLGHALSNLTLLPLFSLYAVGRADPPALNGPSRFERIALTATLVAVTVGVFAQNRYPLLFLPILPVVVIAFRCGTRRTAVALILLTAISSALTLAGSGPLNLAQSSLGVRMQFLQFYLLATVFTIVPIAAELRSRARLDRKLRESEARYRMLADHSSDIISQTDIEGRALFVSPSMQRVAGYAPDELLGMRIVELIDPRDHEQVLAQYRLALTCPDSDTRYEYRGRTRAGQWRWFESYSRAVAGKDGRADSVVSIVRDISDRKLREEQLAMAALTDPLTGLANRRAFRAAAVAHMEDKRLHRSSIAVLDIDHFKMVNDRFGHDAGDEVLQSFASVAQRILRRDDVLARIGGEEFAILFPGLDGQAAARVCERIRAEFAGSICPTAAGPIQITLSGGVADLGEDGLDAALKRADEALYAAKADGRDRMLLAA